MGSCNRRDFGKIGDAIPVPDLTCVQRDSYSRFLQRDAAPTERQNIGLEAVFREAFPIEGQDLVLDYKHYDLEKPRYTPRECKELKLTYGYPLRVTFRLTNKKRDEVIEQSIFLGDMPIMLGGGTFIINGAQRVIVSQLHRGPGVDFGIDNKEGDRILHGGRIIPERGSWLEVNVTKKDTLIVKIDQANKLAATVFLRAMAPEYGTVAAILRVFYDTENVPVVKLEPTMWAVAPIMDTQTGEIIVNSAQQIGERIGQIQASNLETVEVITKVDDYLILNTLAEDECETYEHALIKIYGKLRPGNPANVEKAQQLFIERFYDDSRYRLGKVGRFRLNRKFGTTIDEELQILRPDDYINVLKYVISLRNNEGEIDDIDHLGNRRVRTVGELASDEIRKGLLKLRRTVTDRINSKLPEDVTKIGDVVNSKSVANHIDSFFGRGELSQVVDQTNCLSQLTHERRLSALGPGGLNRKRAGFEVRDVHISHYGRICPIETPEGANIGLISSLGVFACLDEYGFLMTPYRKVVNGKLCTGLNWVSEVPTNNNAELSKPGLYVFRKKKNSIDLKPYNEIVYAGITAENKGLSGRLKAHWGKNNNVVGSGLRWHIWQDFICSENEISLDKKSVSEDSKKEVAISEWMRQNLECIALPFDIVSQDESGKIESLLNCFEKQGLLPKTDSDTGLRRLLSFIEDRLILEFSDVKNPKGIPAPCFNRDFPIKKGSKDKKAKAATQQDKHEICQVWSSVAELSELNLWMEGQISEIKRSLQSNGITGEIEYLRADTEMELVFSPPSAIDPKSQELLEGLVLARVYGELGHIDSKEVQYVDISPKQTVGISASLIPFLEHDDANRALMGSNMMRQAVPLLQTEAPVVGTGMEDSVASNSSMVVKALIGGTVTSVDATKIVIDRRDEYILHKFDKLNERTCLNQTPIVKKGQRVEAGQVLADGGATKDGRLALGKNILVAFVPFDGYNFEDAILINENLVKDDVFTSIHIDEFDIEVRETKLGREEFTRDIPNVGEKMLRNLDFNGIIREGTRVGPGDILVGKVSPKSKTELSPEEKLLHAIFGRAGEDVKNDSLVMPSGHEGVVIGTRHFKRYTAASDADKAVLKIDIEDIEIESIRRQVHLFKLMMEDVYTNIEGVEFIDNETLQKVGISDNDDIIVEQIERFTLDWLSQKDKRDAVKARVDLYWPKIVDIQEDCVRDIDRKKRGDELPNGVLEKVRVYVATKRSLSVGDKMAGRHGNKGIIARILPQEDMPFLEDGTPVQIVLNPLGVPSRMNVGQILETNLGWVAKVLGFEATTPVFDGADEGDIHTLADEANAYIEARTAEFAKNNVTPPVGDLYAKIPPTLKTQLYDGRTGEPFEQRATAGYMYMLKLHHLVDEKIHARATGPYSLITQQPLGGKARTGGQRFGEMEVWALEGYGAAYTLQELITVKSDDIEGRSKIYESMVKGNNSLQAGTPVSFDVLCNEIKGLCLNIRLEKSKKGNSPF